MLKWLKRSSEQTEQPARPMPRWMGWLMFGFIGYVVITGNVANMQKVEPTTTPDTATGATEQTAARDAATDEQKNDFPAIRRTFNAANWQRALDPSLAEDLSMRDFVAGKGRPAQCGDDVTLTLRGRTASGEPFDAKHDEDKPLRFRLNDGSTYRAVELATLGMREGGERIVDAAPALVYGVGKRPAELASIALHLTLEKLEPTLPENAAPLMVNVEQGGEAEAAGAACGDTISVKLTRWSGKDGTANTHTHHITLGARDVALGLDYALVGMKKGEVRMITLPTHLQLHDGDDDAFAGTSSEQVRAERVK